jgi:hypothetical protein
MSLAGAIKALTGAVPPVLPRKKHGEPLEAPEIKAVPLVPLVPPKKTIAESDGEPLTDDQLAELITATAKVNGLDPLILWRWCDELTIKALRSGDPVELRAFQACAEWAVRCGTLRPDGGHDLPWSLPRNADSVTRYENPDPVRCGDCRHAETTDHPALIRCGAGVQAPGACGLWWNTDWHECGQSEKEIQR